MARDLRDAPVHVLLLIDQLHVWRGTETHLFRLLQSLDRERVEPHLAVVGKAGLAAEFARAGLPIERLRVRRALGLSGLRGVAQVAGLVRRRRARLLVSYHTASDLLAPLAGQLAGVPVISCRRDMGFTKKPLHVSIQRWLNRFLDGMIAVSRSVADAVTASEGFPRGLIQVIWNGEDLQRFRPGRAEALRQSLGLAPDALVASCVGGLDPVKDHRTLIEAFSRVCTQHPRATLLIVGKGTEQRRLAAQAAPLGRRVRLLGHRGDVPELLRASDIYVQTSTSEGFSNAILQAMASALPVVVTRVGGNPELVDGVSGVLVQPGDVGAVAGALERLLSGAELRRQMGEAGRQRAERLGSLEVMTAAYTDAFWRTVQGRFPGPSSG